MPAFICNGRSSRLALHSEREARRRAHRLCVLVSDRSYGGGFGGGGGGPGGCGPGGGRLTVSVAVRVVLPTLKLVLVKAMVAV